MARDRTRPYTYRAASSDLLRFLGIVSPDDTDYGLHGLRVRGYNDVKDTASEAVAVAHGGWKEGSNTRYDRFDLRRDIFPLAALMVGATPDPAVQEDEVVSPPAGGVVRHPVARPPSPMLQTQAEDEVEPQGEEEEAEPEGEEAAPDEDAGEPAHVLLARRLAAAVSNSPPARAVTRLMTRTGEPDQ